MQENRPSARTKALLLALISIAAIVILAGLLSGLDLLPSGQDNNQTANQQVPPPPPPDAPASAANASGFTVNQDNVEVRSGPSTEYPLIGHLSRGLTFTPNGQTPDGDWLQFSWEGMDSWVHTEHLIVTDADRLPIVQDFPPPPPPADTSSPGSSPPDSPPPDSSTPGSSPSGPPGPHRPNNDSGRIETIAYL